MGIVHKRQSGNADWHWGDVPVFTYNSNQATKQVLIGREDGANNFEVRCFNIPPRGFSSLDQHPHDHGVMILKGRTRVMLGDRYEELEAGDVVYIPGMERHQFENLTDEVMSFLCIIPPKPVQPEKQSAPAGESIPA